MNNDESRPEPPSRDEAHAKARDALREDFFWDADDPTGPFGNDTALETLEALRDLRDSDPRGSAVELLSELLETWEIADESWDVVEEAAVEALGADDELGLLVRDEAVIALAFGDAMIRGRIDPEIRRRGMLALARQSLPALLHGFGERMKTREARVTRMREILSAKWD